MEKSWKCGLAASASLQDGIVVAGWPPRAEFKSGAQKWVVAADILTTMSKGESRMKMHRDRDKSQKSDEHSADRIPGPRYGIHDGDAAAILRPPRLRTRRLGKRVGPRGYPAYTGRFTVEPASRSATTLAVIPSL